MLNRATALAQVTEAAKGTTIMLQRHPVDGTSADAGWCVRFVGWGALTLCRIPLLFLLCAPLAIGCQELDAGAASGGPRQPADNPDAGEGSGCEVPFSLDPTGEIICGDPVTGEPPVVTETPPIQTADGLTQDPCVQTLQQALRIRKRDCASCHAPPAAMGAFAFVLEDDRLITARSANPQVLDAAGMPQRLVIPGDADNSRLYQRILHTEAAPEGQMPPLNTDPTLPQGSRPSVSDISVLRTWIETCL